MNAKELEESCRAAIDQHVREGGGILFGRFGVQHPWKDGPSFIQLEDNCGCGLSILAKGRRIEDSDFGPATSVLMPKALPGSPTKTGARASTSPRRSIASTSDIIFRLLGLSDQEACDFMSGFDGARQRYPSSNPAMLEAGTAVRQHCLDNYEASIRNKH
jgi:hypothetical protein